MLLYLNPSESTQRRILWIYASTDASGTIIHIGLTTRIDAEHEKA